MDPVARRAAAIPDIRLAWQRAVPQVAPVLDDARDFVALNQIDLLDTLIDGDEERAKVARIVENRRNLRDRSLPG